MSLYGAVDLSRSPSHPRKSTFGEGTEVTTLSSSKALPKSFSAVPTPLCPACFSLLERGRSSTPLWRYKSVRSHNQEDVLVLNWPSKEAEALVSLTLRPA